MFIHLAVVLTICGSEVLCASIDQSQKIQNSCPYLINNQFDFSSTTSEYYRREQASLENNNTVTWCASSNQTGPFLQFYFRRLTYVCSIIATAANGERLVTSYNLTRSTDGIVYQDYPHTIQVDGSNNGRNILHTTPAARYLRIYPITWTNWPCFQVAFTALQFDNVHVKVISEGWGDPGVAKRKPICSIKVNDVDKCPGKIGHNVVVLDPSTGDFINASHFDTSVTDNDTATKELAKYIQGQREQSIIVIAVVGSGHRLSEELVLSALYGIGAVNPLVPCENCSWIVVGKKGSRKPWTDQINRLYYQGPARLDVYIPLEENNEPLYFWRLDKNVGNRIIEEKTNLQTTVHGHGVRHGSFNLASNSHAYTTTISDEVCIVNPEQCAGGLTVAFWNKQEQTLLSSKMPHIPQFKVLKYDQAKCPHSWLTTSNKCCIFPFTYDGVRYTTCTSVDSSRLWCSVSPSFEQDKEKGYCAGCNRPLIVKDGMITESSSLSSTYREAKAKLSSKLECWSPSATDTNPYLQISLKEIVFITAVGTKGGKIENVNHWVKSYYMRYSFVGTTWRLYFEDFLEKVFSGNHDVGTEVRHELKEVIKVRFVRLYPQAHTGKIALKMEIYGCDEDEYPTEKKDQPKMPVRVSDCDNSLGLEENNVAWWDSSSTSGSDHMSKNGRLNYKKFWRPSSDDPSPFLMVTFQYKVFVTALATQGGTESGGKQLYVTSYYLTISKNREEWNEYFEDDKLKIFKGNQDANTPVKNRLKHPVALLFVKIHPKTWTNEAALRAEFYGCLKDNPKFSIVGPVYQTYQGGRYPTYRNQYITVAIKMNHTNLPCPTCKRKVYVKIEGRLVCLDVATNSDFKEFNISIAHVLFYFHHHLKTLSVEVFDAIGPACLDAPIPNTISMVSHLTTFSGVANCLTAFYAGNVDSRVYSLMSNYGRAKVYCDQSTMGGGWMVIQRRFDGTVDFNRNWDSYVSGFGSLDGEFWIGLQTIRAFQDKSNNSMKIDLENYNEGVGFAYYTEVFLKSDYSLKVSGYSGDIGDSLGPIHNLSPFSTNDRDTPSKCSNRSANGWWNNDSYSDCQTANLNGRYKAMTWKTWNSNQPVKVSEIKIRKARVVRCSKWACYYYNVGNSRSDHAHNFCTKFGAAMISITSSKEMKFLKDFLNDQQTIPEKIWIGLQVSKSGELEWTDGSTVMFKPPHTLNTSLGCFQMMRKGETFDKYVWETAKCNDIDTSSPFVCKRGVTCNQLDCFYNFAEETKTCENTKKYCADNKLQMTKIYNKKKDAFITKYIKDGVRTDYPGLNYTNWKGTAPTVLSDKCVVQYKDGWVLENSGVKKPILCERAIKTIDSCNEALNFGVTESGMYTVKGLEMYCDMENDGGGWHVIMRRIDIASSFESKSWGHYQNGFGSKTSSFWAGNNAIYTLTKDKKHSLLINFILTNGSKYYALYDQFYIGHANQQFVLSVNGYSGNAGDSLSYHDGGRFSSPDKDYDKNSSVKCATVFGGGWWFKDCHHSNLNGKYDPGNGNEHHVYWRTLNAPIKYVEMKIKWLQESYNSPAYLKTMDTGNHKGFSISHDGMNTQITVRTSNKQWQLFIQPPLFAWHHVCVTWSEAHGLRYYQNGLLTSFTVIHSHVVDTPSGTRLRIGSSFLGYMTRLMIWERSLEQYTIDDIYNFDNFTFDRDSQTWSKGRTFNHKNKPFSWKHNTKCTPSEGTGPCADSTWRNTRGAYLFAEASSPRVKNNFSSLAIPYIIQAYRCLRFRYHMRGTGQGHLLVNANNRDSWRANQNNRNDWQYAQVSKYGSRFFDTTLEFRAYVNKNFESDIAIDDVSFDVRPCTSQSIDDIPYFQNLGCFKTSAMGSLHTHPFLLYDTTTNAIRKCAHAAWTSGVTVFALRKGSCMGSASSHLSYDQNGPSTLCPADGEGDLDNIQVYVFNDCNLKCVEGIICNPRTRSCDCQHLKHVDSSCKTILHETIYVDASHYWPFDSSSEIADLIGHKSAIVEGSVHTVKEGFINGAVQLSGSSSMITLGDFVNDCVGDFDLCQEGFAISMWVKLFLNVGEVSKHVFVSMGCTSDTEKGFKLAFDPAVQIQGEIPYVSLRITFKDRSCMFKVPVYKGVWLQIGFSFKDSTTLEVYHNGKVLTTPMSEACQAVTSTLTKKHTLSVGLAKHNSIFQIDDLVIWSKWLNESDYLHRYKFVGVGTKQQINMFFNLPNAIWDKSLLDLESEKAKQLMKLVIDNINLILNNSDLNQPITLNINGFSKGSVNVNVTMLFNSLTYNDSLLLEKLLFDQKMLNNMNINVLNISSSTVTEVYPNATATPYNLTAVLLKWSLGDYGAMQLFQGYRVLYRRNDRPNDTFSVFTTWGIKSSTIVSNLEPGYNYTMRMSVISLSGDGFISPIFYGQTKEGDPIEIPSNVSAVNTSSTSLLVNWTHIENINWRGIPLGYRIYYWSPELPLEPVLNTTALPSMNYFELKSLSKYTTYCLNVTAFNSGGDGNSSNALCLKTDQDVPDVPPADIQIQNVTNTILMMSTTGVPIRDRNGIIVNYTVYWTAYDGSTKGMASCIDATLITCTIMGLNPYTRYNLSMTSYTCKGAGPYTTWYTVLTSESVPTVPPPNVAGHNLSSTSIHLSWSTIPPEHRHGRLEGFLIKYGIKGSMALEYKLLCSEHTTVNLTNLIPYREYNISIAGFTGGGLGNFSTLFVWTDEDIPFSPPISLRGTNTSSTSLRLDWQPVPYEYANGIIRGYTIQMMRSHTLYTNITNTTRYNFTVLGEANVHRIFTSLEMYTDYTFQILAFTVKGNGNFSESIVVRTDEDAPFIAPLNLTAESIIWHTSRVNWTLIPTVQIPGICRGYVINYMRKEGTKDFPKNVTVSPTTTSLLIPNLAGYILYDFWIFAFTYPHLAGPHANVTIRTKDFLPRVPTREFTAVPTSSTSIKVNWETLPLELTNGIMVGYLIEYTNNNKSISLNASYPADATSAILPNLWKFNYFSVKIISINVNGFCRNWSQPLIVRTDEDTPDKPPEGTAGKASSPTAIMIKWNPVPRDYQNGFITGHSVFYRALTEAEEPLFDQPTLRIDAGPTTYELLITGLNSFTEYEVTVLANTVKGDGVKALSIITSTCRCFQRISTNWRSMPPYVRYNTSKGTIKMEGMLPEIIKRSLDYCCQECPSFGRVKLDFQRDGYNNSAKKNRDIDVKRNIDDNTDVSFPIFGYNDQTHYAKYYGYIPAVPSSGVAFIVNMKQSIASPNNVAIAVFNCWPLLMLNVIIAFSVGFVIWVLEAKRNPECFEESFIHGVAGGFWFAFVTLTTVGYGDKTVVTIPGRLFTVLWTLFGLVVFGILMGSFSAAFETLAFSEAQNNMMLYGTKVAALDNSSEHRLGLRKNAKVNTENHYKTLEEIRDAMLNEEVKGALIDAYVASYYQKLFEHKSLRLLKIYELPSTYGVVVAGPTKKIQKCVTQYLSNNRLWVAHHISINANQFKKNPKSVMVETAEYLVDDSSNIFLESLELLFVLLVIAFVAGLIYEGCRRHKKKKDKYQVEPAITNELRTSLNQMILLLKKRLAAMKKALEKLQKQEQQ